MLLLMISPTKAIWFLVYLVVLQQLENNLIYQGCRKQSWTSRNMGCFGGNCRAGVGARLVFDWGTIATVLFTLLRNDVLRRSGKQNVK